MTTKKQYDVAESFVIEDLDTLKKLTHPQRIDILHSLVQPRTVKEIAEEIDADPTKLYYHIRQLEQIKAIQVVETNIVSGIVEKLYYVTAKSYTVNDDLFSNNSEAFEEDFTNMLSAVFRSTVNQAKRSAKAGLIDLNEIDDSSNKRTTAIMSRVFWLNDAKLEEFGDRMKAIMDDFGEDDGPPEDKSEEYTDYIFTLAFFPRPPSSLGD